MTEIWSKRKEIRAAFLSRQEERNSFVIHPVANLETHSDVVQALEKNRTTLSEYLKWPNLQLSLGLQVHGTNVGHTEKPEVLEHTDGLVTTRPGLAVGVLVADCAAVLIADRVFGVVAAVHAGWRGAVGGIIEEAVTKMIRMGAEPHVMEAYISPCISRTAFEVGEEVASQFPVRYVERSGAKPHVDLKGFVSHSLAETGIPADRIIQDERCTYREPEDLHSYRRDGPASGRMMAVIALR